MKNEKEINSILLVNWYLIKLQLEESCHKKTKLTRKFLSCKIKKIISNNKSNQISTSKKTIY